jgi:catechol 2,3-dioxygenase-like lactoylglutathione lyase family enzyme
LRPSTSSAVPTRDTRRAVGWYRDVLGLPVSRYADFEVETANVTLAFLVPEAQGEPFVPTEHGMALRVADVHAAVDAVTAAGGEGARKNG